MRDTSNLIQVCVNRILYINISLDYLMTVLCTYEQRKSFGSQLLFSEQEWNDGGDLNSRLINLEYISLFIRWKHSRCLADIAKQYEQRRLDFFDNTYSHTRAHIYTQALANTHSHTQAHAQRRIFLYIHTYTHI